MIIRNLKYYLKQTFKDLYLHRFMSFTSIVTIFSCVLILVISYTLSSNINFFMDNIQDDVSFSAFINETANTDEVTAIYQELSNNEYIESVEYIDKNKALDSMKEAFGDRASSLDGLENDNPLPRSFTIKLKSAESSKKFLNYLESNVGENKYFSLIRHMQVETDILVSIKFGINVVSFFLLAILSFIDVVLIMNTIKMGIELRKNEINIMKYMGATSNFIRMPFIFEGAIVGVIGGLLPPILLLLVYNKIIQNIYDKSIFVQRIQDIIAFKSGSEIFNEIFVVCILFGVSLGVGASILSIRKHLKV